MKSALAGILLTAVAAFAQPPANPPTPADMAQHRVTFLTTLLSLTTAQQQQATTIFTNAATAQASLSGSFKTARENLNEAVKSNDGAAIEQAAAAIGTLTGQRTAIDAKAEAAFYQILTPDQQTKMSQFAAQDHGRFPPEGFPGGGPHPGGR